MRDPDMTKAMTWPCETIIFMEIMHQFVTVNKIKKRNYFSLDLNKNNKSRSIDIMM